MYGVIQKSKARRFLMTSASEGKSAPGGLGANRRTAKYVGGGAAVGAVLGAILVVAKERPSAGLSVVPVAPALRSTPDGRKRFLQRRS